MQAALAAPFGSVLVTTDPSGGVTDVRLRSSPPDPGVPEAVPEAALDPFRAYLEGRAARPDVPVGDVEATSFQRSVYDELTRIPPGQPVTYGELAARVSKRGAARAVGQALRANPLPLVWPCHRVVASDGLGGFGGCPQGSGQDALAIKRWLIEHERP